MTSIFHILGSPNQNSKQICTIAKQLIGSTLKLKLCRYCLPYAEVNRFVARKSQTKLTVGKKVEISLE